MGTPELDGVMIFSPGGVNIGRIALPERCANLCFGGRANSRLFMALANQLFALRKCQRSIEFIALRPTSRIIKDKLVFA